MADLFARYAMYIFVLFGMLAGIPVVWIFRDRAAVKSFGVLLLSVLYSVCSVIAAMLFAHLESFLSKGTGANTGAISTYGIYFLGSAMMLGVSKICRWNTAGVLDIYALYAMPSLFMMRVHCLIGGCCYGLQIWNTGLYWPTREAEIVFYVAMFLVFWRMLKKNKIPGQLFPLLMTNYGVFRFINQWFRDDGVIGLHMSHGWSVLCALIGFSLLMEMRAQNKKKSKSKRR